MEKWARWIEAKWDLGGHAQHGVLPSSYLYLLLTNRHTRICLQSCLASGSFPMSQLAIRWPKYRKAQGEEGGGGWGGWTASPIQWTWRANGHWANSGPKQEKGMRTFPRLGLSPKITRGKIRAAERLFKAWHALGADCSGDTRTNQKSQEREGRFRDRKFY